MSPSGVAPATETKAASRPAWLPAILSGFAYLLVAYTLAPYPENDAERLGFLTGNAVIGIVVGAFISKRAIGGRRLTLALTLPLLVAAGVYLALQANRLMSDRAENVHLGEPSKSTIVGPASVGEWQRADTPETAAAKKQMRETVPDDRQPAVFEMYTKGTEKMVLTGYDYGDLGASPIKGVRDFVAGAGMTDAKEFASGADGVALMCGNVAAPKSVVCAWRDSTVLGAFSFADAQLDAAAAEVPSLLADVRKVS